MKKNLMIINMPPIEEAWWEVIDWLEDDTWEEPDIVSAFKMTTTQNVIAYDGECYYPESEGYKQTGYLEEIDYNDMNRLFKDFNSKHVQTKTPTYNDKEGWNF